MDLSHLVKRCRALADANPHFYTDAEIMTCLRSAYSELSAENRIVAIFWEDAVVERAAHQVIALLQAMDAQDKLLTDGETSMTRQPMAASRAGGETRSEGNGAPEPRGPPSTKP